MRDGKIKSAYSDRGAIIVSIVIIWALGLFFMKDNTSLKIVADEFGYWSAAAWMVGIDWSEVASINPYYGYGYGVLLAPILKLPISIMTRYRLAIILNLIMLTAVYFIIYYFVNESKVFDKKYFTALIALTVTIYTGNIAHTQYAMTETLLLLGFWLFVLLLYNINKKYAFYKIVLGSLLLAYMYSVHQRMIGVAIAGVICLLYVQLSNKKYRHVIFFLVITASLFLGVEYIKNIYQESYLTNDYVSPLNNNDYSGQVSKIESVFSFEGFRKFLIGVFGKVFYVLTGSYLFAGIAVYQILKDICSYVKAKQIAPNGIIGIFILLSALATIAIATIFLINYEDRIDLLFYGRYSEFFISGLTLFGLITLVKSEKVDIKANLFVGILYLLCILLINNEIPPMGSADLSCINTTATYNLMYLFFNDTYKVGLTVVVMYIVIAMLIYSFKKQAQNKLIVYACVLLSVNWLVAYYYNYNEGILTTWANYVCDNEEAMADYIRELGIEEQLYFYAPDGYDIDFLQFLLDDVKIHCIYDEAQIETLPEDAYLLTLYSTRLMNSTVLNDFEELKCSWQTRLWKQVR